MAPLIDPALEQYAAACTTPPEPLLDEIERFTRAETTAATMLSGAVEGRFLRLLVALAGARRVVEVGTFTGYSALMLAAGLPADGTLVTCELDPHHARLARGFFARSPAGGKITLREGPALPTLRTLPDGSVDLIFIDADKEGYPDYLEEALRLLRPGGLLVADNTLWSGRVLAPEDDEDRAIAAFNERLARDPRAEAVLLTLRDGVTLARRR